MIIFKQIIITIILPLYCDDLIKDGSAPLHIAVWNYVKCVEGLLRYFGVDVNMKGEVRETVLITIATQNICNICFTIRTAGHFFIGPLVNAVKNTWKRYSMIKRKQTFIEM